MFTDVIIHAGLELLGQGAWLCIRGRCQHRSHRALGDGLLVLLIAVITVHLIG